MIYKDVLSEKLLWQAWKIVKKRGSHGGADFVSVAQYDQDAEERLADLYKKLQLGKWRPQPYLQISIPKKANARRSLGLLSCEDKSGRGSLRGRVY